MQRRAKPAELFSLKWRVLVATSLLLLALAALFTYSSHSSLTERFAHHQEVMHERQVREIELALTQSEEDLRRLASLVSSSTEMGEGLRFGDGEAVYSVFQAEWPTMQLDAGLDEVVIHAVNGERLASWGDPIGYAAVARTSEWRESALEDERPHGGLLCTDDCRQYAVVPVLSDGRLVGTVMVSRSLAEVARNARMVSDSDVSLLVPGVAAGENGRHLGGWDQSARILTREAETLPVLQLASERTGLERIAEDRLRLEHGSSEFELAALPLGEDADGAHFMLITDVTEEVAAIRQDTRFTLLVGIGGWLAAEALLLGILWGPMARLRRLADALPGLAQGRYAAVREAADRRTGSFSDEIDVLDSSARQLADQLETLESEVASRSQELALRMSELTREKDFVDRLLDTARVIILTQDGHGRITLVNKYAETIVGGSSQNLMGRFFSDVFLPGLARPRGVDAVPSQEEGVMLTNHGTQRTIVWYHAPVDNGAAGTALISVGLDITGRKAAEERLAWLANHDSLTGLYNRRFFQHALDQALSSHAWGAMLFLDLDQFRDVNELSGHHSGDQLLRLVGEALEAELEAEGVVARLGGDEFAVLLEGADAEAAKGVAQRIENLLAGISFSAGGRRHRAVASIGIALYPEHGHDPADLMASADLAMYKAKEAASQRWHLLSTNTGTREELHERVYWVERIRDALMEGGFELLAQPIMRLTDRRVDHFEVLLRMRGEDGTLVPPGLFIPVAERSGQIIELDRWVLRAGLRLLRDLERRGGEAFLAVNLSAQSLRDQHLCDFLEEEFAESGANPNRLVLEVTETAAVTDFVAARGVMQRIREFGCHFALDDFGVGFSSFHYLGQLPADYIKIDGSFIRNLTSSTEDRLIVRAIADIAAGFGKQTVAEFVDDAAILPILEEYGITFAQGYHLGQPGPVEDVMARHLGDMVSSDSRG